MARSRRNSGTPLPIRVVTVLLPILVLGALLNLVPDGFLDRDWPLGIKQTEVNWYKELLGLDRGKKVEEAKAAWKIQPQKNEGTRSELSETWTTARLSTPDREFDIELRKNRSVNGGYQVKSTGLLLFNSSKELALLPATVASIKESYLDILAEELGLAHAHISFTGLSYDGGKAQAYLVEENIDNQFADKTIGSNSKVFELCADPSWPVCAAPSIKDPASSYALGFALNKIGSEAGAFEQYCGLQEFGAALIIMQCAGIENDILVQDQFAWRSKDGRIVPVRRAQRRTASHPLSETSLYAHALAAKLISRNEKLEPVLEEIWRIKERFAQVREEHIPLIAKLNGVPQGIAMSQAEQIGNNILDRLERVNNDGLAAIPTSKPLIRKQGLNKEQDKKGPSLRQLANKYKGWLEKDTLVLPRGRYIIKEDLVIPEGKGLKLLSGVRMFMAPNTSIHVSAPLRVSATSLRPCFIRPLNPDSAWGSIAVNMQPGQTSYVNGLYVSGGSNALIRGHVHQAMLSFHNGSLVLSNSGISSGYGEDLLNHKNGRIRMSKCTFNNALSDLVDLDFVEGSVVQCRFSGPAQDLNGDGLDLSGSKVFVEKCTFSKCRDKGLSVGENSEVLVMRSIFYQDSTALASKDGSTCHVYACSFRENDIALAAYAKRGWLGGGTISQMGCSYLGVIPQENKMDEQSEISESTTIDREVIFRFEEFGAAPL